MNVFLKQGQAAVAAKNLPLAITCFQRAYAKQPKDALVNASLGQALCWDGKRQAGLQLLQQAGRLLVKSAQLQDDVSMLLQLCDQLMYWEDFATAADLCRKAVHIDIKAVRAYQLLALAEMRLNNMHSALLAARKALQLMPTNKMLAILLATVEAANNLHDEARERLENLLRRNNLSVEERFRAHRELALIYDKQRQYAEVFPQLNAAAALAAHLPALRGIDRTLLPNLMAAYHAEFAADKLSRWQHAQFPVDSPAPVFLLGFMRTGTTLAQQVLAAHSQVFVGDEADIIASIATELPGLASGLSRTQQLHHLDWAGVLHLRARYWEKARALYGDKMAGKVFIDKTTMNTLDLNLINLIFPDARIIFAVRDPRDVCLSCFMQIMTPTPMTVQLLNWQDTARFYAQVMNWWLLLKSQLPMTYMELRYEDAVQDFEGVFSKVFSFLGLNWQTQVSQFHKNASGHYINSPSFNQVAQPLYTSSVARWRHYESEFASVADILQPIIAHYRY